MAFTMRMDQRPACVTVNVRPAIVSVPTRSSLPSFLETLNVIVPLPVPFAPVLTVIQESFDIEVHPQPGSVVTETGSLVPEFLEKLCCVGSSEYEQAAACDSVKVVVPTVIVPVRASPAFSSTE
jgi:hypothetical protein